MALFKKKNTSFKFTSLAELMMMHYDAAQRVYDELEMVDAPKTVKVGILIRVLAGGRHALYESNVGVIRKPIQV